MLGKVIALLIALLFQYFYHVTYTPYSTLSVCYMYLHSILYSFSMLHVLTLHTLYRLLFQYVTCTYTPYSVSSTLSVCYIYLHSILCIVYSFSMLHVLTLHTLYCLLFQYMLHVLTLHTLYRLAAREHSAEGQQCRAAEDHRLWHGTGSLH